MISKKKDMDFYYVIMDFNKNVNNIKEIIFQKIFYILQNKINDIIFLKNFSIN